MLRKIYKKYQSFLDEQLGNSTSLVSIISLLIISVWFIVPHTSIAGTKNNILEIQKQNNLELENTIELNWKKYKVYFEEIK